MPAIEVMVWVSEPSVSTDVTFKPNAMLLFSATWVAVEVTIGVSATAVTLMSSVVLEPVLVV
ncbi:hypothetical protein D3C81_2308780 [compost metagenome]